MRARNRSAVRELGAGSIPRRELDIGLPEQRLLAEDRTGVSRDRPVLVLQIHGHVGVDAASLNRGDLETLREASVRLAEMEGLGAHAHAIEVRLE